LKKSKRKNSRLDLVIIAAVILLAAFSLPSLAYWSPVTSKIQPDSATNLNLYQHPPMPQIDSSIRTPALTAKSFILIDNATNTILAAKNPSARIYPASITKLATALTALNIYPLEESITVKNIYKEGKIMELVPGEVISVRSLVTSLLVFSANDAAYNLAMHHRQGIDGFVKEMNLIANNYGLKNTHFTNFDGIHQPDHYSTAYDLSQLGRIAIKNPIIVDTVKNKEVTVTDVTGEINHHLQSTNELLSVVAEIEGLKTGWTPEAGGCFLSLINQNGHYLIGVVVQSDDRFADTSLLLGWAKSAVTWLPYTP